jgi:hypothetical protein
MVAQAVTDYIEHLRIRAKSWRDTQIKPRAHATVETLAESQLETCLRSCSTSAAVTLDARAPNRAVT